MFRVQIPLAFGTTFTVDGHLYIHLMQNTDSGLQNRELLESLLRDVIKARNELPPSLIAIHRPPLVLRITLDLEESQLTEMAEVIRDSDIDDVIIGNTTVARPSTLNDR